MRCFLLYSLRKESVKLKLPYICHGVLFPAHVTVNISSISGGKQPLWIKVPSKILNLYSWFVRDQTAAVGASVLTVHQVFMPNLQLLTGLCHNILTSAVCQNW